MNAMEFHMDTFSADELTGGTELAEYICENYEPVSEGQEVNGIKRFIITVLNDDYELEAEEFDFIEEDMGSNREVWVCWKEYDGEVNEWWITGDDR
ncbi:hypothetical protein [Domibacillus iocasae]|uniref:Uncharacterized protein n=1 Tax=Domibacillus iocasae TaxID=1714016 RepID=A0A1E7DMB6_9BACI|nr:hypothetical protein [Domibacillus iocasae]OES44203.1 hypothetical protein BA724_07885 [Domibacillus iocasae]